MAGNQVPDMLFHTVLTVVDYHVDTSGSTRTVYPLATHTALSDAKESTLKALGLLGYKPDDFEIYTEKSAHGAWTHGDGVFVYAKAYAGQVFLVGIDTTTNTENLPAGSDATLVLPAGTHLHYVMQNKVDYNADRTGAIQQTDIVGVYVKRADALKIAKSVLLDDDVKKSDFSQYDEREGVDAEEDWPFGDDVVVHAVAQTGENYHVAVRTVPGAHAKHAKKH